MITTSHLRANVAAGALFRSLGFVDWEIAWTKQPHDLTQDLSGDPVKLALAALKKYTPLINEIYSPEHQQAMAEMRERIEAQTLAEQGKKIGSWKPEQIATEWNSITVDLSKQLDDAGEYEVEFRYAKGANRLDIRSVSLLRNGVEIASDKHAGSTGHKHSQNVYQLKLKDFAFNTKYELKAEIRSNGGTQSYGGIYLRKK